MITRTFLCDKCNAQHVEKVEGEGAQGWSQYKGIKFNVNNKTIIDPLFCNNCTQIVAQWLDSFLEGV